MKKFLMLISCLLASTLYAQTPPANDECVNAIQLPDISTAQQVAVDLDMATESLDASCEDPINDNRDVWYTVDMPFDGRIVIFNSNAFNRIAIYDACGGNELVCSNTTIYLDSLLTGSTYWVRFSTPSLLTSADFIIQAFATAPHDVCANAIPLGDLSTTQSISLDTRQANESTDASCEDPTLENLDLWYSFMMPYPGKIRLQGIFGGNKTAIYDGCGGNELACMGGSGFMDGLDTGITYYLRYATISGQGINDVFTIEAFPIPPNDDCQTAIDLGVLNQLTPVTVDNRGASQSLVASCESPSVNNPDVWYQFTMPFDGNLRVQAVFGVNKIALFDACGGTELNCRQSSGFFFALDSGTTYLFRYASVSNQAVRNDITLEAIPTAVNDACDHAIDLDTLNQLISITTDNRGALESLNASCEDSTANNLDIWYRFIMPFAGKIRVQGVFGSNTTAVFDGCGGTEVVCRKRTGFLEGLDGGVTYLLRYASISSQAIRDDITLEAIPDAPNDDCANAIDLGLLTQPLPLTIDNRGATESIKVSCESPSGEYLDLWYRFTMPFNGKLLVSGVFGVNGIAVLDACGGMEVDCKQQAGFLNGLDSGVTYLFRYASVPSQATVDEIILEPIPESNNDECVDALALGDVSIEQTLIVDPRQGTPSLMASCEDATKTYLDLWYRFTMPFDGQLRVRDVFGVNSLSVYDACGGGEVACIAGSGFLTDLTANTTYYLRYGALANQAVIDEIIIQAFELLPHDACDTPFPIDDLTEPQTLTISPHLATESLDLACEDSSDTNLDLWFELTMPFDGRLTVEEVLSTNRVALFDSCGDATPNCIRGSGYFDSLVRGTTYILRYAAVPAQAQEDQITLRADPYPANNDCLGAEDLGAVDTTQVVADTRLTTLSLGLACEDLSLTYTDVWYEFSVAVPRIIEVVGLRSKHTLSVFEACGEAEIVCLDQDGRISGLDSSSYFLRFSMPVSNVPSDTFTLTAIPIPPNDQCQSATDLGVISTPDTVAVVLTGAQQSQAVSCDDSTDSNVDVWYALSLPFDGYLEISDMDSMHTLSLFERCGGPELACLQGGGRFDSLSADSPYYIRYGAPFHLAQDTTFLIRAGEQMATNIKHVYEPDLLTLFPNPVGDYVYLKGAGVPYLHRVEVWNVVGKKVAELPVEEAAIAVHQLPNGWYLFRFPESRSSGMYRVLVWH